MGRCRVVEDPRQVLATDHVDTIDHEVGRHGPVARDAPPPAPLDALGRTPVEPIGVRGEVGPIAEGGLGYGCPTAGAPDAFEVCPLIRFELEDGGPCLNRVRQCWVPGHAQGCGQFGDGGPIVSHLAVLRTAEPACAPNRRALRSPSHTSPLAKRPRRSKSSGSPISITARIGLSSPVTASRARCPESQARTYIAATTGWRSRPNAAARATRRSPGGSKRRGQHTRVDLPDLRDAQREQWIQHGAAEAGAESRALRQRGDCASCCGCWTHGRSIRPARGRDSALVSHQRCSFSA